MTMFSSALDSTPVCTIDEQLEVDRIPTGAGGGGDDSTYNPYDDDDATEISQRSFLPYGIMPSPSLSPTGSGGTIRMEGWLNHTTSSHRNSSQATAANSSSAPSSSSSSILRKTVSKKKRQAKKKQPRYFALRGNTLSYYSQRHDVKAKGTFVLTTRCTVGPVMKGSLEDPSSLMEVVDQQQQLADDEFLMSPSASTYSATTAASASLSAEHYANSNKSKKKKRQYFCVQVTWPINNKPSKDEKFMAQAKAQVAAESEKEAMQQQQLELQVDSFEDNASTTQNNENKTPMVRHHKLPLRRARSDSAPRSPQKSTRHSLDSCLPPDLYPPNLSGDDYDNDNGHDHANGHEQQHQLRPVTLLPSKTAQGSLILNTPASTMAGMNAFQQSGSQAADHPSNENNPSTLNHETGLHKHYTQQITKHAKDQQKSAEELQKVMQLLSRKKSHQKAKKKVIQGTKVAAVSTAAITAGVLTAGIGLAAGLVFVGITAAAGGSGAVVGSKMLDKARGKYNQHQSQKSFHLIIGANTYEEALKWKMAMEFVIQELVEESNQEMMMELDIDFVEQGGEKKGVLTRQWRSGGEDGGGGGNVVDGTATVATVGGTSGATIASAPSSPKKTMAHAKSSSTPITNNNITGINNSISSNVNDNGYHHADPTPTWVPIHGGGTALWGILGALGGGGGNLRIYREERSSPSHPYSTSYAASASPWLFSEPTSSAFPTIPRFRSDVGLVGQPFPPFKASIALKANSLDAFMCLMCSGRIHDDEDFGSNNVGNHGGGGNGSVNGGSVGGNRAIPIPNSGQIASFRIIETVDDHMDVIHLVFRPLYLFPSWTAPRDFVLYRFWKYDDDGTYQVCFDSGQHRDCPKVAGYVRGEMHSVYTIAPLKRRKKRSTTTTSAGGVGAAASSNASGLEECLLSHVVQIDPRGWVPTTSSLPFFRNQGYGDAFAVMALHQMLDVKEALDSVRFVAVPMDSVTHHTSNNYFNGQGGRRVKMPRRLLASGSKAGGGGGMPSRPPRGLVRDSSGGSAMARGEGGQQQQQLYMRTLETSDSGYVFEDEEPEDTADYDFKYSGRELFSADGYHQSAPEPHHSSSSANNNASRDVHVRIDGVDDESQQHSNGSNKGGVTASSNISTMPPPMITEWWAEPDANSYRVRGKTYKVDSKKVNAGSSLFRLLAADIVETDIPIMTGMCLHPKERVQLALQREAEAQSRGDVTSPSEMPPFVFVVNIALPGPPNCHIMVFYYAVGDLSTIDGSDSTPSSKLSQEFFFGKDDTFRDNQHLQINPSNHRGKFHGPKGRGEHSRDHGE
mmetsp:Transcript_40111/g.73398  ORF Transcript_40111/g.73398 Transcript_40111/m.73398 type:complete len:1304 (+) Transcript_40111:142-4053(+)